MAKPFYDQDLTRPVLAGRGARAACCQNGAYPWQHPSPALGVMGELQAGVIASDKATDWPIATSPRYADELPPARTVGQPHPLDGVQSDLARDFSYQTHR